MGEYHEKSENPEKYEASKIPEEENDLDMPEFDENVNPEKLVELLFGYKPKETKKFANDKDCVVQDDIIANNDAEEANDDETSKNESANQEKVDLDLEEVHQEAISIKSELEQKENDGDLQDNTKSMHLEQHSIDEA